MSQEDALQLNGTVTPPSPDDMNKMPFMSHSMQLQGLKQNLVLSDLPSSSRVNVPDQNKHELRKDTKELNEYAAASDIESKDLEQLREQL